MSELQATFLYPQGTSKNDAGDVRVEWNVAGHAEQHIEQFNVTWHCTRDGQTHKKVVSSEHRSCVIPLTEQK